MNTCEYCQKEVKRKVFCNNSHRAMYYRKLKIVDTPKEIEETLSIPKPAKENHEGKHFSKMLNKWV